MFATMSQPVFSQWCYLDREQELRAIEAASTSHALHFPRPQSFDEVYQLRYLDRYQSITAFAALYVLDPVQRMKFLSAVNIS
jgi:hypothetical protein